MDLLLHLIPVFLSVLLLLAVMFASKRLGRWFLLGPETQRKLVHIGTGLYALIFPLLFSQSWQVPLLITGGMAVMALLRQPLFSRSGLGSVLHGVQRKSYGELYLALAVGILFFRSTGHLVLYILPLLVITLSDTAAALIGTTYGKKHYIIEDGEKSLEGSAAFFITTWLIAMICLLLFSDIGRLNVVLVSLMIGAFGALVEADSWKGLDNLFVPLAIHLFLQNHMNAPPFELLGLMGVFALAIASVLMLAPALDLNRPAARGYVTLVFLILSITTFFNAILPILAILAHIYARIKRPGDAKHPDLELLAIMSGVAVFWLVVGDTTHHTSINLFNLTFAGAACLFATLALRNQINRLISGLFILALCVLAFERLNPADASWYGSLWPYVGASIALCGAAALFVPDLFKHQRSARVFLLAMVVPLTLLLTKGTLL